MDDEVEQVTSALLTCDCPGWTRRVQHDSNGKVLDEWGRNVRTCRHVVACEGDLVEWQNGQRAMLALIDGNAPIYAAVKQDDTRAALLEFATTQSAKLERRFERFEFLEFED